MTETEVQPTDSAEDESQGPLEANCRHCGQPNEVGADESQDWLCPSCGRYQDSMTCPTCKQTARISLMPAEVVPEAHAPARRRRSS